MIPSTLSLPPLCPRSGHGGFGRIDGLVLSLAILQMISSGFNLLGFSEHLTLALWGITLLAVMAVKRYATTLHQLSRVFFQRDLK